MSDEQNNLEIQATDAQEKAEDPWIDSLKNQMDWFVVVDADIDTKRSYSKQEIKTDLRAAIIEGIHQPESTVSIYSKMKDGKWTQSDKQLSAFAKGYFQLHVLYEPVWSHAMAGLKWGALAGIIIKLLDTTIGLATVNPRVALLFLIAIAVCAIPRIGFVAIAIVSFFLFKMSKMNFFIIAIGSALAGATLGCLPGMAIGGAIGLYRKKNLTVAYGGKTEADGLVLKVFLLPLIAGTAWIVCYILFITPWLADVIQ